MTKMIRAARHFPRALLAAAAVAAAACDGGAADGERSTAAALAAAAPEAPADEAAELLARLNAIPGVEAALTAEQEPGVIGVAATIDQPVDHERPEGERFRQRFNVRHRSVAAPSVLGSSGYFPPSPRRTFDSELSLLLGANLVWIGHRHFTSNSTEAPPDWRYLTIEQAAADYHRLLEALKPIYGGPWLTEGASKGGMAAVYHRRFYPDDVAGTVAYVAPHSYGPDDPRYAIFLEKVGDRDCRERFVAAQREALARRDELVPIMEQEAADFGFTFDVLGAGQAFEHTIIESRFYLWQYGAGAACADVPAPGAPAAELYAYFQGVAGLGFYLADFDMRAFAPFFYQASTELGYYGPSLGWRLHDLLEYPGTFSQSTYPPDVPKAFDPWAMVDVQLWLATQGERVMLIYGENDPFTAGAFAVNAARDSFRFVNAGADHSTGFGDMTEADRAKAFAALERWTGVAPSAAAGARALAPDDPLADYRAARAPRWSHPAR